MNELLIEFLGGFTKTNQWSAIVPEIMLGLLALALLGAEMALPKNKQTLIPCLLYTSPSPRDGLLSRMPSSA